MPDRQQKYEAVLPNSRLYQGEIVSSLVQVVQKLESIGGSDKPIIQDKIHPYAIVVTQDCDLESDFRVRSAPDGKRSSLANVLFCEAVEAAALKRSAPEGKDIWKRIIQNKDERYHCIEEMVKELDHAGEGLPALGIDFKRYFTISCDEVYRRIEIQQLRRRARLITPYAEHLTNRFFYFQSRIALPEDHTISL